MKCRARERVRELCATAKVLEMLESEPKAVLMLRLLFLSPRHESIVLCALKSSTKTSLFSLSCVIYVKCTKKKWVRWACMSFQLFTLHFCAFFTIKTFVVLWKPLKDFSYCDSKYYTFCSARLRHFLTYFLLWSLILITHSFRVPPYFYVYMQKSINHAACMLALEKRRTRRMENYYGMICMMRQPYVGLYTRYCVVHYFYHERYNLNTIKIVCVFFIFREIRNSRESDAQATALWYFEEAA